MTEIKSIKSILPINIVVSLIVFIFSVVFHGTYYEEYEAFFNAMISGVFTPGSTFDSWYFLGHIGLAKVYSNLYRNFPGIEWMSWIQMGYLFLSSILILSSLDKVICHKENKLIVVLLKLLLIYILFADSIINFNYTRCSYFLCGSSTLFAIVHYKDSEYSFLNLAKKGIIATLFLLGVLVRIEPSLGILLLFSPLALIWHNSFKRAIICILPFGLISFIAVILVIIDINQSKDFYKQIEPDLEYSFGIKSNIIPLSEMKTAADSIKHEAACNMIWADPNQLTLGFLKSLIVKDKTQEYYAEKWAETKIILAEYGNKYQYLILSTLFMALSFILMLLYEKKPKMAIIVVTYLFYFFLLIVSQIYFKKLRYRAFSPMLDFTILTLIVYFLYTFYASTSKTKPIFLVLFVSLIFGAQVLFNISSASLNEKSHALNKTVFHKLQSVVGNEILLLNGKSFGNFTLKFRPFEKFSFDKFKRVYVNEAQVMSLIPQYHSFLEKECVCNVSDFSAFYKHLLNDVNSPKVFLLSDEKRLYLTLRYLKIIHNYDFCYEEIEHLTFPELLEMDLLRKHNLHLYHLYSLKNENN